MLGDVVVRLRQETKDYQGLKNSRCRWHRMALVTTGPEELFRPLSFGVSCLTGQHLACLFTESTPASPAKSMVSQIKPRSRQVLMRNHMRHGFEDLPWIYHFLPVFAKFVMLETFGNVDILGLDIESTGLNSVILRLREVSCSHSAFWETIRFPRFLHFIGDSIVGYVFLDASAAIFRFATTS